MTNINNTTNEIDNDISEITSETTTSEIIEIKKNLEEILSTMNTSAKMRYLHFTNGWSYYRVAKYLNKRPQHVRNVCITPVKNPK